MTATELIPLASWGFLVGFVGWAAFSRVPEPIVDRLFRFRSDAKTLKAMATLLVIGFMLACMFLTLSLMPMFLLVGRSCLEAQPVIEWRDMFGVTFVASLAGFVVHGIFRRFGSAEG